MNNYWGESWRNGSATVNGRAGAAKGIIIIRFEMPWNIWCTGCKNHIGRGVRYNAEKNKAGKFYTTTIWNFKMKCHLCPGTIVIETDPKNDDYKVRVTQRPSEPRACCVPLCVPGMWNMLRTRNTVQGFTAVWSATASATTTTQAPRHPGTPATRH